MNKQQIESAVKEILDKEESPLETAYKYEVANYDRVVSEIKTAHERNLRSLLQTLCDRGLDHTPTADMIRERIIRL